MLTLCRSHLSWTLPVAALFSRPHLRPLQAATAYQGRQALCGRICAACSCWSETAALSNGRVQAKPVGLSALLRRL